MRDEAAIRADVAVANSRAQAPPPVCRRLHADVPDLLDELGRLRADNQRLTAELAKTQDASATLYGAFEDAAEARDHATAQVLIQNGETNRAATEAGLEQQRAERAEAERDALRAAVDAALSLCSDVVAVEDHGQSRAIPPTRRHLAYAVAAALGATTEPDRCVKCWQFPPCNCAVATTTQTSDEAK